MDVSVSMNDEVEMVEEHLCMSLSYSSLDFAQEVLEFDISRGSLYLFR